MNQSFQEFILIVMQFSLGKLILKDKFEISFTEYAKPDFVFRTEIRFSGFRLTSLKYTRYTIKQLQLLEVYSLSLFVAQVTKSHPDVGYIQI